MVGFAHNGTIVFPKFNVGDIRYLPRVHDRYIEDETTDGEYLIIRRKVVFEPSVKAKEVRVIEAIIGYDKSIAISYRMLTVGETEDIIYRIAKTYDESFLETRSYPTYEAAMNAAQIAASEKRYLYE